MKIESANWINDRMVAKRPERRRWNIEQEKQFLPVCFLSFLFESALPKSSEENLIKSSNIINFLCVRWIARLAKIVLISNGSSSLERAYWNVALSRTVWLFRDNCVRLRQDRFKIRARIRAVRSTDTRALRSVLTVRRASFGGLLSCVGHWNDYCSSHGGSGWANFVESANAKWALVRF